jgi:hypothetical protein
LLKTQGANQHQGYWFLNDSHPARTTNKTHINCPS